MATAKDLDIVCDEYSNIKCSICAKKNKVANANYYCYDCQNHMCTYCLATHNENHNVVQGLGDDKDVITKECGKHADEIKTLYCHQDDELSSGKCRLLEHRKCQDTQNIRESSAELNADPELQTVPAQLKPALDNVNISLLSAVVGTEDRSVQATVERQGNSRVVGLVEKRSGVKAQNRSKQVRMVKVKLQNDKDSCYIRGCCYLDNGSLVIADNTNRRLKLVDPSSGKITKYCDTDEEPRSVCCIGPQEVAVAFFCSTQVHVYNAVSLTRTRTIELGHETYRIACHGGLLYCATADGNNNILYVHDVSDGRELREFRLNIFFISDIAVNGSGDRLYVTDWCGLLCVNTDGQKIFYLSVKDLGLSNALGMTTDHHGHVFVCGQESNKVVKVTEDGHVVGEILSRRDGIVCPLCLSYDVSRSQLCVGGESDQILMVEEK